MQNHIDGYKAKHVGIANWPFRWHKAWKLSDAKANKGKIFFMSSLHSNIKIWLRNSWALTVAFSGFEINHSRNVPVSRHPVHFQAAANRWADTVGWAYEDLYSHIYKRQVKIQKRKILDIKCPCLSILNGLYLHNLLCQYLYPCVKIWRIAY